MSVRQRVTTASPPAADAKPAAWLGDVLAAGLRERLPRRTAPTDESSAYKSEIADSICSRAWVPRDVLVYAQFANGDASTFVCAENTLLDAYKTREVMNAGFKDTTEQDLNALSDAVQLAIDKISTLQHAGWGLTDYDRETGNAYEKPQTSGNNPSDMVVMRIGNSVGAAEPPRLLQPVNVAEFTPAEFEVVKDHFILLLKRLLPGHYDGKCDQQLFYMLGSNYVDQLIARQPDTRCERTVEKKLIVEMKAELQPLLDMAPNRNPATRVAFGFFM